MPFLRRALTACLLCTLALLCVPRDLGAQYTAYHQLRKENPVINEVIATLPDSSLHGTLNRISALLTRAPIRDLTDADLNTEDALPDNFVRGMELALADLEEDVLAAEEAWAQDEAEGADRGFERYILVQVIEVNAVRRNVQLHQDDSIVVCEPSVPLPGCDTCGAGSTGNPAIVAAAEDIILVVDEMLADAIDYLESTHQDVVQGLGCDLMTPLNYEDRIDDIRDFGIVHGEPIIDL